MKFEVALLLRISIRASIRFIFMPVIGSIEGVILLITFSPYIGIRVYPPVVEPSASHLPVWVWSIFSIASTLVVAPFVKPDTILSSSLFATTTMQVDAVVGESTAEKLTVELSAKSCVTSVALAHSRNTAGVFDISKTRISTVSISSSFFAVPVPVIVREDTDGRFTSGTVNVKRIPFPAGEGVDSNSSCTHPVSHTVINRTDKR